MMKESLYSKKTAQKAQHIRIDNLLIIPGDKPPIFRGSIIISKGKITGLCLTDDLPKKYLAIPSLDGKGFVAIPGLINSHTHAAMGFFRGLGQGKKEMIEKFFFPAEKNLDAPLVEALSYSYLYDSLRSGVTTIVDHYYFSSAVGRAINRIGLRGFIGETIADLGGAFPSKKTWQKARKEIESWPFSDLVRPTLAPHATDTVSGELLKEIAKYAVKMNLPLQMHLSQSSGERSRLIKREGLSPVAFAEKCGALTKKSLVVHLVSASNQDLKIIKRSGATAVICPASQIIYERLAPLGKILGLKIPVAFATDCAASNDGADLLVETKIAGLLCRDRGNPLSPRELLKTINMLPAKALGAEQEIGSLTVGKSADIVFLERNLSSEPMADPETNLIYSMGSRDIKHVMINGEWVLWQASPLNFNLSDISEAYDLACLEIKKRVDL